MKNFIFIFLCVFFSCAQEVSQKEHLLSPQEFSKKITEKEVQLVDVRTPDEWSQGVIEEALTINFFDDNFKEEISKLDKNKPIAIYCRSGGRSGKAAKILTELGFIEIYDLKGGIIQWNKEMK